MKVVGSENPADVLTKYKSLGEARSLLSRVNVEVVGKVLVQSSRGHGGAPEKDGWLRLGHGVSWADAEDAEWEGGGESLNMVH